MIIRCSECGVQYRIDEARLSGQARPFRCSRCGEILHPVPSSQNAAVKPTTGPRYLLVSCPDCGTKYRLNAQRLKEGKSGLRCRNCSRIISLRRDRPPRSLKVSVIRVDQPESGPPDARQPVFQTYSATPNSNKRKRFLLASSAALLLAVVAAAVIFGYPLLRSEGPPARSIDQRPVRSAPAPEGSEGQPLVLLEADLPALRLELQKRLPGIADDARWRIASAVLDAASLKRAKLFLYPDPKNRMLPVLVVQGDKPADLKKTLLRSSPGRHIFVPTEGNAYRFSPIVTETAATRGFPAESYRIWFHNGWVVCAPLRQAQLWEEGKQRWNSFSVARFCETLENPIELTGLAVRIPESLPHGWIKLLIPDSVRQNDPESKHLFDAAASFLNLLDRSMQQIDSMAGVFRFVGDKGRLLQYAQQFRQGVDGNRIFTRLQIERTTPDRRNIETIFSKLLQHERLNTTVELYERRMTVSLGWQADDDQALLKAVIEAIFGPNRSEEESRQ